MNAIFSVSKNIFTATDLGLFHQKFFSTFFYQFRTQIYPKLKCLV